MDDDFNTSKAIGDLSDVFKLVNELLDHGRDRDTDLRTLRAIDAALRDVGATLGLFLEEPRAVLARIEARRQREQGIDPAEIERLIGERIAARKAKDFARADAIRNELLARGIVLKDQGGTTVWEVSGGAASSPAR